MYETCDAQGDDYDVTVFWDMTPCNLIGYFAEVSEVPSSLSLDDNTYYS
jgi:hypothetical protein